VSELIELIICCIHALFGWGILSLSLHSMEVKTKDDYFLPQPWIAISTMIVFTIVSIPVVAFTSQIQGSEYIILQGNTIYYLPVGYTFLITTILTFIAMLRYKIQCVQRVV